MNNNISLINLVLLIVILLLGLTGNFGGGTTGGSAAPAPTPTAEAPAPAPAPAPTAEAPAPAPAPTTTIAAADWDAFLEMAHVEGNPDAKVSVVEFSDVQCPFCQRHTNGGTLDQVKEKYGDDVNIIFGHFPLSFHQNAQKAGEALECANDQGKFAEFKKAYFAKAGDSNLELARAAAEEVGLDADALIECVNAGTHAQKVTDSMAFGRKWGVTGTPGNLVVNTETLEFQKISGAVPASSFDPAVSAYIN